VSLCLALLVFPLKKLKLGEPLIESVSDFRPTGVVLVLNDWHVCIQSFEVRLLSLAGRDCLIGVVTDMFPAAGTVSDRVPLETGTDKVGGSSLLIGDSDGAPAFSQAVIIANKRRICS
jgi:hypothetical protein